MEPITNSAVINYQKKIFQSEGDALPYRILYPSEFSESTNYPILFFLHGAGERGDDNDLQLTHGGQLFLDSISTYPSIIVFPQCHKDQWWANNKPYEGQPKGYPPFEGLSLEYAQRPMQLLELLIDSLVAEPYVDSSRVYIAGLSMGGMGTTEMLARRPEFFAAAAVICGIAPLEYKARLNQTPTWIFHGLDDAVVLPDHSEEYFKALQSLDDQRHRLSLYPGVGHDSWTDAFAEPDFLKWLYTHSRSGS